MKFTHRGYSLSAKSVRGIRSDRLRLSAAFSRSQVTHHYKRDDGVEAERSAERYGFAMQAFGFTWAAYIERRETPLVAKRVPRSSRVPSAPRATDRARDRRVRLARSVNRSPPSASPR